MSELDNDLRSLDPSAVLVRPVIDSSGLLRLRARFSAETRHAGNRLLRVCCANTSAVQPPPASFAAAPAASTPVRSSWSVARGAAGPTSTDGAAASCHCPASGDAPLRTWF